MAFSPAGNLLAVPDSSGDITVWDVIAEKRRHLLKGHTNLVTQLTFSPDGATLIAAHAGRDKGVPVSVVKHWDVGTGKEKLSFILEGGGANRALSADGRLLVTVHGYPNKTAKVWDLATKKEIASFDTDSRSVSAAALTADGKVVAIGGGSGDVKLWELLGGKPRGGFKLESGAALLTFSRDGRLLAAKGEVPTEGYLFWDVAAAKQAGPRLKVSGCGCFSPDGKVFASPTTGGIQLWSVAERTRLTKLNYGEKVASGNVVLFSPDGGQLATGTADHIIRIWDVPLLKP